MTKSILTYKTVLTVLHQNVSSSNALRPFAGGDMATSAASWPSCETNRLVSAEPRGQKGHPSSARKGFHSNLLAMASNLKAMASNLGAMMMASNLRAMASNLLAMASNLRAMTSNLRAMASNLLAMASTSDGFQPNRWMIG